MNLLAADQRLPVFAGTGGPPDQERCEYPSMPIYSHSRLGTYENCPLKYKFQYIDGLEKSEEEGVEAFVGSRVHEVLQKLYKEKFLEKSNTLDDLLAFYKSEWEKNWTEDIRIVEKGLTERNYFDYGAKCIRNYYEQYYPFDQAETLDTEVQVVFPLDSRGNYQLQGYIDRLAKRPDGTYEIHDYKTNRKLPTQADADRDRQLALYQMGVETRWSDVGRVDLFWHYVGFKTTIRSQRRPQQLTQLKEDTIRLIDQIQDDQEFRPRKSALCNWCEYRGACPLWSHPEKVRQLPAKEFKKDEGVRLADSYATTHSSIQLLKTQLEEIREKVIAYSHQYKASVIQGSGISVSITRSVRTVFPSKGDPQRDRLERVLKKMRKWGDVAELNTSKLLHKLDEHVWSPRLIALVTKFTRTETSEAVRLHKTSETNEE